MWSSFFSPGLRLCQRRLQTLGPNLNPNRLSPPASTITTTFPFSASSSASSTHCSHASSSPSSSFSSSCRTRAQFIGGEFSAGRIGRMHLGSHAFSSSSSSSTSSTSSSSSSSDITGGKFNGGLFGAGMHLRSHAASSPPSPSSFSSSSSSSSSSSGRRFNVGVFGAGRIGRMHLANVASHRRLKLQWVVEDSEQARQITRDELFLHDTTFNPTALTPSLLSDPSLDGVFILTPTESHASLITQALQQGKAVFVEKPTAETAEEIDRCYSLAEAQGTHLFTGFQRRQDPVMTDLYSAVRERKAVGKVFTIKTVSRDSPKPDYSFLKNTDPNGCNILSDMAVHDVDLLVWLTEAETPEFIFVVTHAHDAVLAASGIDDSLMVVIKYKSGVIATIDSCRETTYGYDIRVEVFGSEGMVMAENPREATSVIDDSTGGTMRRLFYSFPQRFEKAFQLEIDHFVRCMDGSATPAVTKEQALMTARIIEKGVQSFRQKAPVYF